MTAIDRFEQSVLRLQQYYRTHATQQKPLPVEAEIVRVSTELLELVAQYKKNCTRLGYTLGSA